ncbi:Multiple inositol polyphosphate phosphatase 1 [Eumeta japonica]|uniref:Multiple inositol polyphosphate phosphatase 1 n=1 Tax=Eumeta variegata TaxID=151549 RepID=A0A4C1TNA9_EUMVA|nr:Multiple inositol polyphosphate phosphatase 1 [Eumeta japonica]
MGAIANFIFVSFMIALAKSKYCYWNTGCPYKYLSSETPYDSVRGDIRDTVLKIEAGHTFYCIPDPTSVFDPSSVVRLGPGPGGNLVPIRFYSHPVRNFLPYRAFNPDFATSHNSDLDKAGSCEPVSVWSLFRHGEKNPDMGHALRMRDAYSLKDVIISAYHNGSSGLCAQDVQNLRQWKWDRSVVTAAHQLRPEGYKETVNLAKRLKEIFPEIFTSLTRGSYALYPTDGEWNSKSAEALVEGLDGSPSKLNIEPLSVSVSDSILSRTGIDYPLSGDNVTALYDLCRRFWSNTQNEPSPWCAIFNTEDLRVLEYVGDLITYYRNGYGDERNVEMGKHLLGDLYNLFDNVKGGGGERFVAHFSDGPLVGAAVAALGLYKDSAPLSGERRVVDRKWRSSTILPLGANILAVMHSPGPASDSDSRPFLDFAPFSAFNLNSATSPSFDFEEARDPRSSQRAASPRRDDRVVMATRGPFSSNRHRFYERSFLPCQLLIPFLLRIFSLPTLT